MSQNNKEFTVATYTMDEWAQIKTKAAESLMLPVGNEIEYSISFIALLLQAQNERWFDVNSVSDEVRCLAGLSSCTVTKDAEPLFKNEFRGQDFWHKHFFDARFIPKNISNELKRDSAEFKLWINKEFESLPEDEALRINWLIHQYSIGALEYRAGIHESVSRPTDKKRITGEWIIYKPYQGKLYFLDIAFHNQGSELYRTLKAHCEAEYPFLFH
ncbi:hypothetical protein Meth11DRAFT_0477 [Methylophilaceae bacterium 11]|nr:hypothetical protein Meth11DRAFT_0477 [Methylophilaceae bacterium 11]